MLTKVSIAIVATFAFIEGYVHIYLACFGILISVIVWEVFESKRFKHNWFALTMMCFALGIVIRHLWELL